MLRMDSERRRGTVKTSTLYHSPWLLVCVCSLSGGLSGAAARERPQLSRTSKPSKRHRSQHEVTSSGPFLLPARHMSESPRWQNPQDDSLVELPHSGLSVVMSEHLSSAMSTPADGVGVIFVGVQEVALLAFFFSLQGVEGSFMAWPPVHTAATPATVRATTKARIMV